MSAILDGMDLIAKVVALANGELNSGLLWFADATNNNLVPWTNAEDPQAELRPYVKNALDVSKYTVACARVQFSIAIKKLLYPIAKGVRLQFLRQMDTVIPKEVWEHLVFIPAVQTATFDKESLRYVLKNANGQKVIYALGAYESNAIPDYINRLTNVFAANKFSLLRQDINAVKVDNSLWVAAVPNMIGDGHNVFNGVSNSDAKDVVTASLSMRFVDNQLAYTDDGAAVAWRKQTNDEYAVWLMGPTDTATDSIRVCRAPKMLSVPPTFFATVLKECSTTVAVPCLVNNTEDRPPTCKQVATDIKFDVKVGGALSALSNGTPNRPIISDTSTFWSLLQFAGDMQWVNDFKQMPQPTASTIRSSNNLPSEPTADFGTNVNNFWEAALLPGAPTREDGLYKQTAWAESLRYACTNFERWALEFDQLTATAENIAFTNGLALGSISDRANSDLQSYALLNSRYACLSPGLNPETAILMYESIESNAKFTTKKTEELDIAKLIHPDDFAPGITAACPFNRFSYIAFIPKDHPKTVRVAKLGAASGRLITTYDAEFDTTVIKIEQLWISPNGTRFSVGVYVSDCYHITQWDMSDNSLKHTFKTSAVLADDVNPVLRLLDGPDDSCLTVVSWSPPRTLPSGGPHYDQKLEIYKNDTQLSSEDLEGSTKQTVLNDAAIVPGQLSPLQWQKHLMLVFSSEDKKTTREDIKVFKLNSVDKFVPVDASDLTSTVANIIQAQDSNTGTLRRVVPLASDDCWLYHTEMASAEERATKQEITVATQSKQNQKWSFGFELEENPTNTLTVKRIDPQSNAYKQGLRKGAEIWSAHEPSSYVTYVFELNKGDTYRSVKAMEAKWSKLNEDYTNPTTLVINVSAGPDQIFHTLTSANSDETNSIEDPPVFFNDVVRVGKSTYTLSENSEIEMVEAAVDIPMPVGACAGFSKPGNNAIEYYPGCGDTFIPIQTDFRSPFPLPTANAAECRKVAAAKTNFENIAFCKDESELNTVLVALVDWSMVKLPSVAKMTETLPPIDRRSSTTILTTKTAQSLKDICACFKNMIFDVVEADSIAKKSVLQEPIDTIFELYPATAPGTALSDKSQNRYQYFPQHVPKKPPNDFTPAQLAVIRTTFHDVAVEYLPWKQYATIGVSKVANANQCGFLCRMRDGVFSIDDDALFWPNSSIEMSDIACPASANAEMAIAQTQSGGTQIAMYTTSTNNTYTIVAPDKKRKDIATKTETLSFIGIYDNDFVRLDNNTSKLIKNDPPVQIDKNVQFAATTPKGNCLAYMHIKIDDASEPGGKQCLTLMRLKTDSQGLKIEKDVTYANVLAIAVANVYLDSESIVAVLCAGAIHVNKSKGTSLVTVSTHSISIGLYQSVNIDLVSAGDMYAVYAGQDDGAVYEFNGVLSDAQGAGKRNSSFTIVSAPMYEDRHSVRTISATMFDLKTSRVCVCTSSALIVFHRSIAAEKVSSHFFVYSGENLPTSACFDPASSSRVYCWDNKLRSLHVWDVDSAHSAALVPGANGSPRVYAAPVAGFLKTLYAACQFPFGNTAFFDTMYAGGPSGLPSFPCTMFVCPHHATDPGQRNVFLPLTVKLTVDLSTFTSYFDIPASGTHVAKFPFTGIDFSYFPKLIDPPTYNVDRYGDNDSGMLRILSGDALVATYALLDVDCSTIAFPGGDCSILPPSICNPNFNTVPEATLTPYALVAKDATNVHIVVPKFKTRAMPYYETKYLTDKDCEAMFQVTTEGPAPADSDNDSDFESEVRTWLKDCNFIVQGMMFLKQSNGYIHDTNLSHFDNVPQKLISFEDITCNTLCAAGEGLVMRASDEESLAGIPTNTRLRFFITASRMLTSKINAADFAADVLKSCLGACYPDSKVLASGKRAYLKATVDMLKRLNLDPDKADVNKVVLIPQLASPTMYNLERRNNDEWIIFYEELMRAPRENALIRPYTATISGVSTPTIMHVQGCYVPSIRYASILASVFSAMESVLRRTCPPPHNEDHLFDVGRRGGDDRSVSTGALLGRAMVNASLFEASSNDYGQRFKDRQALAHITDQHTQAIYALSRVWSQGRDAGPRATSSASDIFPI